MVIYRNEGADSQDMRLGHKISNHKTTHSPSQTGGAHGSIRMGRSTAEKIGKTCAPAGGEGE
jgi:hypothetical protein